MRAKTSFSFIIIVFLFQALTAQPKQPGYLDETDKFEFYGHFWFNMHHFFQQEALIRKVADSTIIQKEILTKLDKKRLNLIDEVVTYYQQNLVEEDLRMSDYQSQFRKWIITQDEKSLQNIPNIFKTHCSHLISAAEAYRDFIWSTHISNIHKVLKENISLVRATEQQVAEDLSNLTKSRWQDEKLRVDMSYFAKSSQRNLRNRPYTSLFPTHVVMAAFPDANTLKGNWLELLYHESSHHLIGTSTGFVSGTIGDVSNIMGQKSPRGLWHAYLFYFSGIVTQRALVENGIKNYETYMYRYNVFGKYIPLLQLHLPDYMSSKSTLHDTTKGIISGLK